MLGIDKAIYVNLSDDGTSAGETNMAQDGSTPVTFYRGPASGRTWNVHRIIFNITDAASSITPNEFGGAAALTNGCSLLVQRDGGTVIDFTDGRALKQNADFGNLCYDLSFHESGNAANTSNVQARFTFTKAGQPLVLNGKRGERIAMVVNDDLTDLLDFVATIQGYEVS